MPRATEIMARNHVDVDAFRHASRALIPNAPQHAKHCPPFGRE